MYKYYGPFLYYCGLFFVITVAYILFYYATVDYFLYYCELFVY
jgi:hypothetical protein